MCDLDRKRLWVDSGVWFERRFLVAKYLICGLVGKVPLNDGLFSTYSGF